MNIDFLRYLLKNVKSNQYGFILTKITHCIAGEALSIGYNLKPDSKNVKTNF